MSVNSRIQIPKGILKCFGDKEKSGRIWYLNVSNGKIGLAGAGKLGTLHGYYSDEMEKYLNQEIETPLMQLNAQVRSFLSGNEKQLNLTVKSEDVLKKYILGSIARSDFTKCSFETGSITAQFCDEQDNHDFLVSFATENPQWGEEVIGGYSLGLLVNRSLQGWRQLPQLTGLKENVLSYFTSLLLRDKNIKAFVVKLYFKIENKIITPVCL